MTSARMVEVANELLRLSKSQKLPWEESMGKKQYRVIFPDLGFRINGDDISGYHLFLIGETGQVIDSLHSSESDIDTMLSGKSSSPSEELSLQHRLLREIYQLAKIYVRDEKDAGISKALEFLKKT